MDDDTFAVLAAEIDKLNKRKDSENIATNDRINKNLTEFIKMVG
jgi:hypothetical protein